MTHASLQMDQLHACRAMLDYTDKCLQWSQTEANVQKCQSMAIEASIGKIYDPKLKVAGGKIPLVSDNPVILSNASTTKSNPCQRNHHQHYKITIYTSIY